MRSGPSLLSNALRDRNLQCQPLSARRRPTLHRSVCIGSGLLLLADYAALGHQAVSQRGSATVPPARLAGAFLLARDNRLIQTEVHKLGLAPRVGPLVKLAVLGTRYNGYWTRSRTEPISAERFSREREVRSEQLLHLGLADLDHPKNAGLIDDRFVVVDFSIVQGGERYLGAERGILRRRKSSWTIRQPRTAKRVSTG